METTIMGGRKGLQPRVLFSCQKKRRVPKIGGDIFLGFPIRRVIVFWGLYWEPPKP